MTADAISRRVRQDIFDGLRMAEVKWHGDLDDTAFLSRLYDLEKLPSFDSRYKTALGDIWQHRVNNWDWEDDWLFDDRRFNLLNCEDEQFLAFLCEMAHPVVRKDRSEAVRLISEFNDQLKPVGWELVPDRSIAGRDTYVWRKVNRLSDRSVVRATIAADVLDANWMRDEIRRLEKAADTDPALAIGTAKDLVESCCKTILSEMSVEVSPKADLPKLTKMLTKELGLLPEDVTSHSKGGETVRLILRNLSAITGYIAELRGLYGSGHGRDGKHKGLQPRHAHLAVGAAVTFIDFVVSTHREQRSKSTER